MRDADTEGMQHFDGEIDKLVRAGTIDFETGMAYATNPGNLRLQMSDFLEENAANVEKKAPAKEVNQDPELVIEA